MSGVFDNLAELSDAVEDVLPEVPEVHHVSGELHLFCTYPFSDRHIMIYLITFSTK